MIRTGNQRVCRGYHPCSRFGGLWVSDFVLHERAGRDCNWGRAKSVRHLLIANRWEDMPYRQGGNNRLT